MHNSPLNYKTEIKPGRKNKKQNKTKMLKCNGEQETNITGKMPLQANADIDF